jgi:hypothetical protein
MSGKLQKELGIGKLGEGALSCSPAPGIEIGEVGGESAKHTRSRPSIGDMLEGGHISVGQDFGMANG